MNDMVFSWAEDANGKMVHVDSVPRGLNCGCTCPYCHERLQARHGEIRAHGFAHHSDNRGANLKICYMVIMYKLAEQIIQQEKKIHAPSYYGIFKDKDIIFSEVTIDDRYDRIDKQPDVIAITPTGEQYLIEFTFEYKVQHKNKIDYKNLNCIEIDLSSQTLETLRDFILNSSENKKWLNNQLYFEQIEKLYSDHGKLVKVTKESNCKECDLKTNCCGIRLKGCSSPISIDNSGESYRVCKVEEFDKAKKQLDKNKKQFNKVPKYDFKIVHERKSSCESFDDREHQLLLGRSNSQIIENTQVTISDKVIENRLNRIIEKDELALIETQKIRPEQRTCFMCRRNLEYKCKGDGYACCASYEIMQVSKKTPPDVAKTCRGFLIKL